MAGSDAHDDLVTLIVKPNEFQAAATVAMLHDAGIEAWAFAAGQVALPLGHRMTGVPVQVRQTDLERAQEAMRQQATDAAALDWDAVDVGEGDREDGPQPSTSHRVPLIVRIGFALAAALIIVMLIAALAMILGWP